MGCVMDCENKKLRIEIWLILLFIVMVVTFYWLRFEFFLNLIQFWLMGLVLSFALVFILHKLLKLWKIPVVIIGLDLIYHFQYTYIGEGAITYYLVEIPFIILTILFTIWIYIFNKIKIGV